MGSAAWRLAGLPDSTKVLVVWLLSTTPDCKVTGRPKDPVLADRVRVTELLSASATVKPDSKVGTPTLAMYWLGTAAVGGADATRRLMVLGVSGVKASLSLTVTVTPAALRPACAVKKTCDRAAFKSDLRPSTTQDVPLAFLLTKSPWVCAKSRLPLVLSSVTRSTSESRSDTVMGAKADRVAATTF